MLNVEFRGFTKREYQKASRVVRKAMFKLHLDGRNSALTYLESRMESLSGKRKMRRIHIYARHPDQALDLMKELKAMSFGVSCQAFCSVERGFATASDMKPLKLKPNQSRAKR